MTHHIPPRALVLLAILTLVWGTNWPLFPLATREVSVWTFRAVSVFVAGVALLLAARLRGQSLVIARRHWRTIVVATFFYLVVWNIASTYSALLIPSGQSAVLGFTMPLWSALIAWAVLGERLTARLLLAIALGAAAVALLMWKSFAAYAQAPLGLALGLLAGIGWAVGTLILQRGRVDVPAIVLTGWQLLITAVPTTIGALLFGDHQWFVPSWSSILLIAYIALVPMAIGNLCWFSIVGLLPGAGGRLVVDPGAGGRDGGWRIDARRTAGTGAVAGHGVQRRGAVAGAVQAGRACADGGGLGSVARAAAAQPAVGRCGRRVHAADDQAALQVQRVEQAHRALAVQARPARHLAQVAGAPAHAVDRHAEDAGHLQPAQVHAGRHTVGRGAVDLGQQAVARTAQRHLPQQRRERRIHLRIRPPAMRHDGRARAASRARLASPAAR